MTTLLLTISISMLIGLSKSMVMADKTQDILIGTRIRNGRCKHTLHSMLFYSMIKLRFDMIVSLFDKIKDRSQVKENSSEQYLINLTDYAIGKIIHFGQL